MISWFSRTAIIDLSISALVRPSMEMRIRPSRKLSARFILISHFCINPGYAIPDTHSQPPKGNIPCSGDAANTFCEATVRPSRGDPLCAKGAGRLKTVLRWGEITRIESGKSIPSGPGPGSTRKVIRGSVQSGYSCHLYDG